MRKIVLSIAASLFILSACQKKSEPEQSSSVSAAPTAGNSQTESSADTLQPIGSFIQIEGEEEPYGHQIRLWKRGGTLIGQLTYWEWNSEGQGGDFTDGVIDEKTGAVKFRVTVERHDISPVEYSSAEFSGVVKGDILEGSLKWEGEKAISRGENGLEKVTLARDGSITLLPFKSIKDWQDSSLNREKID